MRLTAFVLASASAFALAACTPADYDETPEYDSAPEQIADSSGSTGRSATPPPATVPPLIMRDSGVSGITIVTYRETGCKFMVVRYASESVAIEKLGCPVAPPPPTADEPPIVAPE